MNLLSSGTLEAAKQFTICRALPVEQVNWLEARDLLTERYNIAPAKAHKLLERIASPFEAMYELAWFRNNEMRGDLHRAAAAICEVHELDSVIIRKEQCFTLFDIAPLHYRESLNLIPDFCSLDGEEGKGRLLPTVSIMVGTKGINLSSQLQVGIARLLFFGLAAFAFALVLGLTLYAVGALAALFAAPEETIALVSGDLYYGCAFFSSIAALLLVGAHGSALLRRWMRE